MNKPTAIMFGAIGALSFVLSALRPELLGDGMRLVRWQRRWR